jgi:hypothetical protein
MTRAELLAWLDARRPEAPPTLRAHLRRQLTGGPESLPELLAARGRAALDRVLARPGGGRELALDLLVADALVTYAFEAQAEQDPRGLAALARRISGGKA